VTEEMAESMGKVFEIARENEALQKQVAELRAQVAAVPVDALRRCYIRDREVNAADTEAIEAWLDTLVEVHLMTDDELSAIEPQPEAQP
jgi:hypothetical protein